MRTEINSSYHYANYERWQHEPFVIGQRIWLSPQHPCEDICDDLAGDYPKDFKWAGWHPQCMCASAAILCDKKEMDEIEDRLVRGEDLSNYESPNRVKDVPQQFKDYVERNQDKLLAAKERGKLGYVWKDNEKYVKLGEQPQKPTPLEIAKERHAKRTQADIDRIKAAWNERKSIINDGSIWKMVFDGFKDVDTSALSEALRTANWSAAKKEISVLEGVQRDILAMKELANPMKTAKQWGIIEAKTVNDAIAKRMARESFSSLDTEKRWLETEIKWVTDHKKYKTWEVSRDAYQNKLKAVEQKIYVRDITSVADSAIMRASGISDADIKKASGKISRALKAGNYDKIEDLANKLNDLVAAYEKANAPTVTGTLDDLSRKYGDKMPATLRNLKDKIEKSLVSYDADKAREFSEFMLRVFEMGDFGMNMPLYDINGNNVVDALFKSYFKNQIETGTGKGTVDISRRMKAAEQLFGCDISKMTPVEYEKYGFLMDKDILKQFRSGIAKQYMAYGDGIQIRFRKDKVLATFTMGDSLSSGLTPSLTTDPKATSIQRYALKNFKNAQLTDIVEATHKYASSYIELQYHGKLTLDCIESVYIPEKIFGTKIKKDAVDLMKKCGCKVFTSKGDTLIEL